MILLKLAFSNYKLFQFSFIYKYNLLGSKRILKGRRKELSNPQKNILDGDLLFEYFNLSYTDRNDIAKKIKTNTEQV
jgi:hypothetical protein